MAALRSGIRTKATGTRASVLMPIIPSARTSTPSPVTNAMSIERAVFIFRGMQRIIAGRIVT
jgi:hypothetical protein